MFLFGNCKPSLILYPGYKIPGNFLKNSSMLILLYSSLLLLVNVKAASNRGLPYYIKAYLYNTDFENYEDVVQKINGVLGDVIKGEPVKRATPRLSRYFKNCDNIIEHWLLRWNLLLSNNVDTIRTPLK